VPVVATESLQPGQLSAEHQHQVYCGLDCCVTLEVFQELRKLRPSPPAIYDFERALQGPYLEIMQRGFAVDQLARDHAARGLRDRIGALSETLNLFSQAFWGKPLNPRSPAQLKDFFYKSMGLPEVWISQKGERKLSTNRETLEKLETYLYARPIISCILAIRDLAKQLEVFETEIDSDGRYRTSYNIAGTETGRPSSSSNAFGTGGNAQNIAAGLRYVFVADPGWKLCVIDLEQVEARDVGWFIGVLFGDWSYLDSCESGDLHTNNCKLIWPELPWTGNKAQDRKIADKNFYREMSHRDMSKRGGHLSNYYGTSWTMSRHLKIPHQLAEDFQQRYCRGPSCAYPGISQYWQWIATQLQTTNKLVTPFGRERHFFGRPGDDTTLREAIAFLPQSTTADRMNLGLWRVWKHMPQVRLLAQTYDSITFECRDEPGVEARVIPEALERIRVELTEPGGRRYVVPGEAKVGWNWSSRHDDSKPLGKGNRSNPLGLVKWKPGFLDTRIRTTGLQRTML
jgi:DNA polymerase-1